jgi:hypothetical protein
MSDNIGYKTKTVRRLKGQNIIKRSINQKYLIIKNLYLLNKKHAIL